MPILRLFLLAAILLAISVSDIRSRKIPNMLVIAFLSVQLASIIAQSVNVQEGVKQALFAAVFYVIATALLFLVMHLLSGVIGKNGIGGGDIKLITAFACVLGISRAMLACIIACALALLFARLKGLGKSDAFPFGPFLSIGAIVCLLMGD